MQESTQGFESFVAIVESSSISGAARALGVPRETLSRRLLRLENRLGVRLVHRTSRKLELTPAGHELFSRARPLVVAAQEAAAAVRQLDGVPRGLLRASVPPGSSGAPMAQLVRGFLQAFPEVQVELVATTRHVDLVAEGFDVALRAGRVRDPRLIARRLFSGKLLAVAAPDYLRQHGTPGELGDLGSHRLLLGMAAGQQAARSWPTRDGREVAVAGRLACNDLLVLRAMALAGEGIALLPEGFVQEHVQAGALHQVLPETVGTTASIWLVWVERKLMPPKVRAFIDHVVANVATLEQLSRPPAPAR